MITIDNPNFAPSQQQVVGPIPTWRTTIESYCFGGVSFIIWISLLKMGFKENRRDIISGFFRCFSTKLTYSHAITPMSSAENCSISFTSTSLPSQRHYQILQFRDSCINSLPEGKRQARVTSHCQYLGIPGNIVTTGSKEQYLLEKALGPHTILLIL